MSKLSYYLQWFYDHRLEIFFILSLILLVLYVIFKEPIDNYLKDKHDFELPKPIRTKKKITKKYERQCRLIMERIFNKPFPCVRPQFLKRSNGKCLELDGYNMDLNLAFEYNGVQHYKFSPKFHKTKDDLVHQIKRDKDKRTMCKINGTKLVEIPYTVKYEKLEAYIKGQLVKLGYNS
jgi:hypothetical protein